MRTRMSLHIFTLFGLLHFLPDVNPILFGVFIKLHTMIGLELINCHLLLIFRRNNLFC
jgi:hypothetical protein